MKKLLLILCSVSFFIFSCTKNDDSNQCAGKAADLNGTWQMVTVKDNATGITTSKPAAVKAEVVITFSDSGATKGIFTGNTPTNIIYGAEYTTNCDRSFLLSYLSMTKVAENEWGILFVDHIRNASKYDFESNNKLTIITTNKTLGFVRL